MQQIAAHPLPLGLRRTRGQWREHRWADQGDVPLPAQEPLIRTQRDDEEEYRKFLAAIFPDRATGTDLDAAAHHHRPQPAAPQPAVAAAAAAPGGFHDGGLVDEEEEDDDDFLPELDRLMR